MSYKITFFTFLFFFTLVNFSAQEKVNIDDVESRYVYLLKYQIDSLDKSSSNEEYFILERGKEKSQFMGVTSYNRDSLAGGANRFAFGLDPKSLPKTNFTFRVIKNFEKNNISYYDYIVKDNFIYEEKPDFNWKITGETKEIGNLKCQAALVTYAGRDYKAWFTNEIPVFDGPYKFYGLPGLIVEIEDSKKQYTFELVSYKTFSEKPKMWISKKRVKGKTVKKSEFYKAFKNFHENFVSEIAKGGFSFDSGTERQIKDRIKKKNNPIELAP